MSDSVIDLTVFLDQTVEVRFTKDLVLNVRKPTQSMVIRMMELDEQMETDPNSVTAVNMLYEFLTDALSNNKEGTVVTSQLLEEIGVGPMEAATVYHEIGSFTMSVMNRPTSDAPQSPPAKTGKNPTS